MSIFQFAPIFQTGNPSSKECHFVHLKNISEKLSLELGKCLIVDTYQVHK